MNEFCILITASNYLTSQLDRDIVIFKHEFLIGISEDQESKWYSCLTLESLDPFMRNLNENSSSNSFFSCIYFG